MESVIQLEGKIMERGNADERNSVARDTKTLSGDDNPNKISESIVKCLLVIFFRMSSKKSRSSTETLSSLSMASEFSDPYRICSKFGKRDIGPYKHLFAVEAASINPNKSNISVFLVRRLKYVATNYIHSNQFLPIRRCFSDDTVIADSCSRNLHQ